MANNRMFMVHVPSGLAVSMGKRMSWGWYADVLPDMNKFYDVLDEEFRYEMRQDDFSLVMEDISESPRSMTYSSATVREDGLFNLVLTS